MQGLNFLIVTGEASGDVLAAGLVTALKARRPDARFFGMAGDRCRQAGVEIVHDAREVSVMGISEVIPRLFGILRVMRSLTALAKDRRPDAAILVDIPDFNLRLARKLRALGIRVVQYVSPSVWAWRRGRVRQMAENLNRVLCLLPFEQAFLAKHHVPATYVGHPAVDEVPSVGAAPAMRAALGLSEHPTVALLPGSRPSEVDRILPSMLRAAGLLSAQQPELQFVIPVASTIAPGQIEAHLARSTVKPHLIKGRTPEVVAASDAAVVASGTAVLEAGLMLRPLVVVYRMSWLSALVAWAMIRVAYVGLVNLLAGRLIVPELLQGAMKPEAIADRVRRLLDGGAERDQMIKDLETVRSRLGNGGASARAAEEVLAVIGATCPVGANP